MLVDGGMTPLQPSHCTPDISRSFLSDPEVQEFSEVKHQLAAVFKNWGASGVGEFSLGR